MRRTTMTIERARRLVVQYAYAPTPELVEKVAQRMVATGECVWHAGAQVCGSKCHCADCNPR